MPNQTTYYSRMAKSAPDKIAAISTYTKAGTRVLDFGSGLNLDVAEFVSGRGGAYTSVDNERSVVDAMLDAGFESHTDLCYIAGREFDVIFLSSVLHELFSYCSPLVAAHTFADLAKLLAPDGVIVIRDWYVHPADQWELQTQLTVNEAAKGEVYQWLAALQHNGVIGSVTKSSNWDRYGDGVLTGCVADLYEVLYHCVWGIKSLERESAERYAIRELDLDRLVDNNGLLVMLSECHHDYSYDRYFGRLFSHLASELRDAPSKHVLVLKKA